MHCRRASGQRHACSWDHQLRYPGDHPSQAYMVLAAMFLFLALCGVVPPIAIPISTLHLVCWFALLIASTCRGLPSLKFCVSPSAATPTTRRNGLKRGGPGGLRPLLLLLCFSSLRWAGACDSEGHNRLEISSLSDEVTLPGPERVASSSRLPHGSASTLDRAPARKRALRRAIGRAARNPDHTTTYRGKRCTLDGLTGCLAGRGGTARSAEPKVPRP